MRYGVRVLMAVLLLATLGAAHLATSAARAQPTTACGPNPSPTDPADPAIVVTSPFPGTSVTSPLFVSGRARVFEAVVSLTLFDATGNTLASGSVMAQAGAPTLAPFAGTLPYTVTAATPACLWVFEASARDGSPINVVQVPLTLLPPFAPTETVSLAAGCNNVAMTWPNGAPIETVAVAVMPFDALQAIWLYVPERQGFFGWSPLPGAPVDLLAVSRLDAVFICMSRPGTLTRPAV